MIHLKDNFKANAPISQVPASWFNQVASFINNLLGGYGIKMTKNATGASVISVDPEVLHINKKATKEFKVFETPSVDLDNIPASHRGYAKFTDTWERGTKGVKVYLPTDTFADGVGRYTMWRLCEFDRYGCLQKIGDQKFMTECAL